MKGSRILVAGGTGFIGRHLVHFLHQAGAREIVVIGKRARAADAMPSMFIACDLAQSRAGECIKNLGAFDFIFNLVAVLDLSSARDGLERIFLDNVMPLVHLVKNIDWPQVKGAVHTGSNAEYGNQMVPHREEMPNRPLSDYAWAKTAATNYALMMTAERKAKWCVARPFFVYGPEKKNGLIHAAVQTFREGKEFTVADRRATRDPVFVGDVVEALARLAVTRSACGQIVNICSGKETSVLAIVHEVRKMIGRGNIVIAPRTREGDFQRSRGSNRRLQELTGWKPSVSFAEGLRRTIHPVAAGIPLI